MAIFQGGGDLRTRREKKIDLIFWYMYLLMTPEGHRFDSCWENSDFSSESPVSLIEETSFLNYLLFFYFNVIK